MSPTPDEEYRKLLAQKQLEQAVVVPGQPRGKVSLRSGRAPMPRRSVPAPTRGMLGLAVIALIIAGVFFVRMQEPEGAHVTYSISPVPLASFPVTAKQTKRHASHALAKALPSSASVTVLPGSAALAQAALQPRVHHPAHGSAVAAAATTAIGQPNLASPVDRTRAVVALADPDVAYASGGRAVEIHWYVQAQDHAVVHVLNQRSKIIAQSSIAGDRSHALVNLPRGYNGGVNVEVIAIGYHGERVVQSASLGPPGG